MLSEPAVRVSGAVVPTGSRLELAEFRAVALLFVWLLPVEPVAVIPGSDMLSVALGSVLLG